MTLSRKAVRLSVDAWRRLNLTSPKTMLAADELAWIENFMLRRGGSLMLRPGYARFLGGSGAEVLSEVFTDDFNRADGALGGDWTTTGLSTADWEVVSNEAAIVNPDGIDNALAKQSSNSYDDDQYAEVVLSGLGAIIGPCVRVTGDSGFLLYATKTSTIYQLGRFDSSDDSIHTNKWFTSAAPQAGDKLQLRAVGSRLKCYKNGTLMLEANDTTYTSGVPGIYWSGSNLNNPSVDNFKAGDVQTGVQRQVLTANEPKRGFHFERDDGTVVLVVQHAGKLRAFTVGEAEWAE